MSKTTTPELAIRHEALYLRLNPFLRQVETAASKRPDGAVPDSMRALAEAMLFDARRFSGQRGAIPPAAPDLLGLALQLAQALAALEVFEDGHSGWDDAQKCFVWSLPQGKSVPVRRLKPKVAPKNVKVSSKMAELRKKLARRLDAKIEQEYDRGVRDGMLAAARGQRSDDTF